jgi:hypothetical protein
MECQNGLPKNVLCRIYITSINRPQSHHNGPDSTLLKIYHNQYVDAFNNSNSYLMLYYWTTWRRVAFWNRADLCWCPS